MNRARAFNAFIGPLSVGTLKQITKKTVFLPFFLYLFAIFLILPSVCLALDPNIVAFGEVTPYYCSEQYATEEFTYCGPTGCYYHPQNDDLGGNCGSDIENRFTPRTLVGIRTMTGNWNGYPTDVVYYFYSPLPPVPTPACDWGKITHISCTNSYAAQEIDYASPFGGEYIFPEGSLMIAFCGDGEQYRCHFPGLELVGCRKTPEGGNPWFGWPTDLFTFYYDEPLFPYG